ncbi:MULTISPECIES: L-threonylcarbamoyladenylate synthase [unclassified Halanaerobium]|uniref:L-threonylcarbamoyladenylate synthase n=1 Tax=unclassified Halanaerobium TaxID=2641197 RepID=UPI000E16A323|nr:MULTISPECIES: L-threonylcarbamoyladenylate synthase [unclassified Halanaerobium]RCW48270.1 L-threonylcarbamoyladenylate synthase [Halanaerobium sp. MA284_MarDTE_T2]RCW85697.1 L-threonylcarbamoyladenylate synthase [Halanaerobium sp. DL-01]
MYNTKILKIENTIMQKTSIELAAESKVIQKAAEYIKRGELAAFPTETVYGLGADALNSNAVKKIFAAKGRPQDNPLIVHVADLKQLKQIIKGELSEVSRKLINKYWPGPLTLIFQKSSTLPDRTTAGLDTVAVRMPDNKIALALIKAASLPIAAPSANTSGYPSPTEAEHVYNDLNGKIPVIIDGGPCRVGLESTVLDIRGEKPVILRPGGITREDLSKFLDVEIERMDVAIKEEQKVLSPGMKYRHYSPAKPVFLFNEESFSVMVKRSKNIRAAVITAEETKIPSALQKRWKILKVFSRKNPEMLAQKLFSLLRCLDEDKNIEEIYVEKVSSRGIGEAVMNRIKKAALDDDLIPGR